MALKTYDDLAATVADWLNRGDLSASIPTFIALAEANFNTDERFRGPAALVRSQAPTQGEFLPVPADFIEMEGFRIVSTAGDRLAPVEYVTPSVMEEYRHRIFAPARPLYYTTIGTQIQFLPVPDAQYIVEMLYYGQVPALSPTNETNWLMSAHPNIYLFGALAHAAPYLKDDGRIAVWGTLYEKAVDELNVAIQRAQFGSAPMKMRARSFG